MLNYFTFDVFIKDEMKHKASHQAHKANANFRLDLFFSLCLAVIATDSIMYYPVRFILIVQLYFDYKNFQYFLKDEPNPDEITEIMKLNSNPYLLLHQDVMPGLN